MTTAYVNGKMLPLLSAGISVHDRGFTFADGVYEVIAVKHGTLLDFEPHLNRLQRSAGAIGMDLPMSMAALRLVVREFVGQQVRKNGALYLQLTRGKTRRNHLMPHPAPRPGLVMYMLSILSPSQEILQKGVSVVSAGDTRWARCDIKSTALLANILAKDISTRAGAKESWLLTPEGMVTEGSASNAYIIDGAGNVLTHPKGPEILGGITREVTLQLAREEGITVQERPFNLQEAYDASEAFLTSTTNGILPVVSIDGRQIGHGKPGPLTQRLMAAYAVHIELEFSSGCTSSIAEEIV